MKTTEWFICLAYENYSFLIPHKYKAENSAMPEIFIDFDRIAKDMFSVENEIKHPVALTIKCDRTAMLSTSAIPSIFQANLKNFHIPEGIIGDEAKRIGLIAVSFTEDGISVIVNPELLHEKWSSRK